MALNLTLFMNMSITDAVMRPHLVHVLEPTFLRKKEKTYWSLLVFIFGFKLLDAKDVKVEQNISFVESPVMEM